VFNPANNDIEWIAKNKENKENNLLSNNNSDSKILLSNVKSSDSSNLHLPRIGKPNMQYLDSSQSKSSLQVRKSFEFHNQSNLKNLKSETKKKIKKMRESHEKQILNKSKLDKIRREQELEQKKQRDELYQQFLLKKEQIGRNRRSDPQDFIQQNKHNVNGNTYM